MPKKVEFRKTDYKGITKKVVDGDITGFRVMYDLGRKQVYDPKTETYITKQVKTTKMVETLEEAVELKMKMDKKRKGLLKEENYSYYNLFDDFLDYINKGPDDLSYKNSIKNHINHAKKFFDGPDDRKYVNKSNGITIEDYFLWLNEVEGLQKTTIQKHKTTLNLFFQYLIKRNLVTNNLARNASINVVNNDFEAIAIPINDVNRILKYVVDNEKDYSIIVLVGLAGLAGLRRGEIAGLKWKNLDFEKRQIKIVDNRVQIGSKETLKLPKNDKSRMTPMCKTLYDILRFYKVWQERITNINPDDFVYKTEINLKCDYDPAVGKISRRWRECLKRMNKYFEKKGENKIPQIRLHDLRHTIITNLESGTYIDDEFIPPADFVQVHFAMGHAIPADKDTTSTRKYLHDLGYRDSITEFLNKCIIDIESDLEGRAQYGVRDFTKSFNSIKASRARINRTKKEVKKTVVLDNEEPLPNIHDFKRKGEEKPNDYSHIFKD